MAQVHSYYITNAKEELKFSSSNLSENELETTLREITTAMINNDDLFIDDDDDIVSDDGIINLNEDDNINNNSLHMANIMNLDDFRERSDDNSNLEIQQPSPDESVNYEDSGVIDFEAILDVELGLID